MRRGWQWQSILRIERTSVVVTSVSKGVDWWQVGLLVNRQSNERRQDGWDTWRVDNKSSHKSMPRDETLLGPIYSCVESLVELYKRENWIRQSTHSLGDDECHQGMRLSAIISRQRERERQVSVEISITCSRSCPINYKQIPRPLTELVWPVECVVHTAVTKNKHFFPESSAQMSSRLSRKTSSSGQLKGLSVPYSTYVVFCWMAIASKCCSMTRSLHCIHSSTCKCRK